MSGMISAEQYRSATGRDVAAEFDAFVSDVVALRTAVRQNGSVADKIKKLIARNAACDHRLFRHFGTTNLGAILGLAADDRRRFQGELDRRTGAMPITRR